MLLRNAIALNPPLNGGVVGMAQLTSDGADTTPCFNSLCISHDASVRTARTQVNVENVRSCHDVAFMDEKETIGRRLLAFKSISGLSLDEIATRAGYKGRSGVQRYFSTDFDADVLSVSVARKLAEAFAGTGVEADEITSLAGIPPSNAVTKRFEGAPAVDVPLDLPVFGTALGGPRDIDGAGIEQTTLNTGEIIDRIARPPILKGVEHAYALYVQGESMFPRFEDGDMAIITSGRHSRPPSIGDDVVLYIADEEVDDGQTAASVFIKRLVRKTSDFIELRQFNPDTTFKIPAKRVLHIDRVVPWPEILSR